MPKFLVEIVDDDGEEDPWEWLKEWMSIIAVVVVGGFVIMYGGVAGIVAVFVSLFLFGRLWSHRARIVAWIWKSSKVISIWIWKYSRTLASWIWHNSKRVAAWVWKKTWTKKR